MSFMAEIDPSDDMNRAFLPAKQNNNIAPVGRKYRIIPSDYDPLVGVVRWEDEIFMTNAQWHIDIRKSETDRQNDKNSARWEQAEIFLEETMRAGGGQILQGDLEIEIARRGVNRTYLYKISRERNIKKIPTGKGLPWIWITPE